MILYICIYADVLFIYLFISLYILAPIMTFFSHFIYFFSFPFTGNSPVAFAEN